MAEPVAGRCLSGRVLRRAPPVKIRDEGLVRNKAVYLALAITSESDKDVLGLWIEQSEGGQVLASDHDAITTVSRVCGADVRRRPSIRNPWPPALEGSQEGHADLKAVERPRRLKPQRPG